MVIDSILSVVFCGDRFHTKRGVLWCFKLGLCVLCLTVEVAAMGVSQDEAEDANSPSVSDEDDR